MANDDFNIRDFVQRERHAEVFDWLCKVLGKTPRQLVSEMLTQSLVKEYPAYREAHGGGGQSSKNLETLVNRLG